MYRGVRIAAVVPAYKEENHIGQVIKTMPDFVDHIVIVDDCSPDDTSGAARRADDGRVTLIRHEVNQGVGGAVLTAHKAAMELGSDINVVMAGDAQMDPEYLPQLLDPVVDGYGFAKANRFFSGESLVISAKSETMLGLVPPLIGPALIVSPGRQPLSCCACTIWCASSRTALRPLSGLVPACAARPSALRRYWMQPLRWMTTVPTAPPPSTRTRPRRPA